MPLNPAIDAIPNAYHADVRRGTCTRTADAYIEDPDLRAVYEAALQRMDAWIRMKPYNELEATLACAQFPHFASALGVTPHDLECAIHQRLDDAKNIKVAL